MKKRYSVRLTYANGKKERIILQVRNLEDAIRYVEKLNSQTNTTAEILCERKVVYTYA